MKKKLRKKVCKDCKQELSLAKFYVRNDMADGRYSVCKKCFALRNKKASLKRKYGMTIDNYNLLLQEQGGCCAVCGKHVSENNTSLAVDHNHKTNHVRGLLCTFCNYELLGRLRDAKGKAIGLVKYLQKALKEDKYWKD